MARVTVFLVKFTDPSTTWAILSRRWFTRKGAEMFGRAILLEDTATDIDDGDLKYGEQWTPIDYVPKPPRSGERTISP